MLCQIKWATEKWFSPNSK